MYHYQRFCSFRASSHIAMYTQGVASLALGYVLHWAFSPYLHIHFYYTVISNETVHWF